MAGKYWGAEEFTREKLSAGEFISPLRKRYSADEAKEVSNTKYGAGTKRSQIWCEVETVDKAQLIQAGTVTDCMAFEYLWFFDNPKEIFSRETQSTLFPTTMAMSLPVELLHDIALYLDRDSLISLAQSCRVLYAVAIHHLHRNVPRLNGPDTIRRLNTFATTPDIAGRVRTFNIYASFAVGLFPPTLPPASVQIPCKGIWDKLLAVFRPPPSPLPLPPPAPPCLHFIAGTERISLQNIANAFYNMNKLHTLIIHAPSHPRIWDFEHPIPTLQTVFVHHSAESPSLFKWIMMQKSITYLRMNVDKYPLLPAIAKRDSSLTPPLSLPNLRYLTCNPGGVFYLFPGGRVSELVIVNLFEKLDISVVDHLATVIAPSSAKSGIQLRRLSIYGAKVAINHLLERLDDLLPNLLFFRIFAVDKFKESVSSIPQVLLIMKDFILTAITSNRNEWPWNLSYQSLLVSRLLSFSPRPRAFGIQAHLLQRSDKV